MRQSLNVRQVERLAQEASAKPRSAPAPQSKDADTRALENDIATALGLPVAIHHHGDKGGEVRVSYKTLEQLDEICRRLARAVGGSMPMEPTMGGGSGWTGEAVDEPLALANDRF